MVTVGLAGYGGGRMAEPPALHHLFAVPSSSVHRVQEVQTTCTTCSGRRRRPARRPGPPAQR